MRLPGPVAASRALYRTRQVLHALAPRLDQAALLEAAGILSHAEAQLFHAMQKRDQRHAIAVLRRLQEQRLDEPSLLKAALLHDCGKGAVPVWLRIAYVLAPHWMTRHATQGAEGWRGGAFRLVHHARLGAEAARAAGCSPEVVGLIAGHVEPERRWCLELLRAADDAS